MESVQPPPLYAMAFIDGQNLYRHAKEAFGYHFPNYDPAALHQAICAARGWKPTLVRFYTGVPDQLHDKPGALRWSNHILAMKRKGIHVTTRTLRYREKEAYDENGDLQKIVTAQEKGIDLRIALDVVSCSLTKQFDVGIIFSQDQDLNEIVSEIEKISKQQNRNIKLVSAFPVSDTATSKRGIYKTDWFRMNKDFYDVCLDSSDYRPKV